ncbi:Metallo-hydrolase/oxidoreductase [Auriculariales sp. MPI-PUGE-AT-0066]|nr:Metallo-hydrolase/oxidoreductase [Auriculariales sp. MPI-PUGE-AT-0066]
MSSDSPTLSITLLGAGQEVGRSCCVLSYRGRTVVCDAGVHPAYSGMASLPFVDSLDWSTVDAILVTHFHLDHAASLTYIMEKTNFRDGPGKVYMTPPTKAIYKFMMQDFVRMSNASTDALFNANDLYSSLQSIIAVSAHQVISPCPGISFTPYHAGHVLGACMYNIDIAGVKVLYTGDYSREEDRHLVKAEVPPVRPDVLIVESTYGVQSLGSREDKETRFVSLIHEIIRRGGHALLPVFALGRAQELLLILDDYWAQHPELHSVPIYYASNLAKRCMNVYQTYIHTMNASIRARFARRDNPFVFKHISHLPPTRSSERRVADGPPCVVLASPGMLQSGLSRELLETWSADSRNGLVVTGYSVEGTLARDILNEPDEIPSYKGDRMIPRRLSVHYISFSAHVDYAQNAEFIELIKAQHIVLVHGEQNNMGRLRAALQSKYKDRDEDIKIHTPKNLEEVRLSFRGDKVAKAIGTLAEQPQKPGSVVSGLLVSKDYSYTLLDPKDLPDFAGLSTSTVTQKQRIAISCGFELVKWHLQGMFGTVQDTDVDGIRTLHVMNAVEVQQVKEFEVVLRWESNASNDMIADSTLALIVSIETSPASVKMTTSSHKHEHPHPHADAPDDEWETTRARRRTFGEVRLEMPEEKLASQAYLIVRLDDSEAQIHVETMTVTSDSDALKKRIESVLEMAIGTTTSLAHTYTSSHDMLDGGLDEVTKEEDEFMAEAQDEGATIEVIG